MSDCRGTAMPISTKDMKDRMKQDISNKKATPKKSKPWSSQNKTKKKTTGGK